MRDRVWAILSELARPRPHTIVDFRAAKETFSDLGIRSAAELVSKYKSFKTNEQLAALSLLGRIRYRPAERLFMGALSSRNATARGLGSLGIAGLMNRRLAAELASLLHAETHYEVQLAIVQALAWGGSSKSIARLTIPVLTAALSDKGRNRHVRGTAAEALIGLASALDKKSRLFGEMVHVLVSCIKDTDPTVRMSCAAALCEVSPDFRNAASKMRWEGESG